MELLWELAFTISLSLLLPLVFLKLLSVTPNFEANEKVAFIGRDHDVGVKSDSQRWETEKVVRIMGKIDEFSDKPILEKLIVPKIVDVSCGSPKTHNSGKNDEDRVNNEIELVDLEEDLVVNDCGVIVDESDQVQGVNNNINELDLELMEWETSARNVEEVEIAKCEGNYNENDESIRNEEIGENTDSVIDEDDWEGIERTELERRFGAAVVFVGSKSNANVVANLSNDVKMKLHGYHRIATQGPCQEPQPMALKFSARAKWIAWRQLGIMSPEQAMEQYINLLSESIPNWMADYPYVDSAKLDSAEIHASA